MFPKRLDRSYRRLKFWKRFELDHKANTFKALELCPLDGVKCVILGDRHEPYGVAYSAPPHVKPVPRTTQNVISEYVSDLGYPPPRSGDLRVWGGRGVLLLPIRLGRDPRWELLTFELCRALSVKSNMVFHLWGKNAAAFRGACDGHIFRTSHPGPYTCHDGFLGSKPFTWTNSVLARHGIPEIDWRLD